MSNCPRGRLESTMRTTLPQVMLEWSALRFGPGASVGMYSFIHRLQKRFKIACANNQLRFGVRCLDIELPQARGCEHVLARNGSERAAPDL
ncbi:hypothetical protein M514_14233 [Trichuris suis]|uniref:Uncharacterized protein n=1 Tax=Trichuris suis TaxID=68888 RepID=A0A085LIU4_9BILA|nr:hypothetical protein M513_14233 [Trichuris suis]KFD59277.1 hypothetical protein M514_14233 [Trichuris suis]